MAKTTKTLQITSLQVQGIKDRNAAVEAAQSILAVAVDSYRSFVAGVVAGHGIDTCQAVNVDDATNVLTIEVEVPDPLPPEVVGDIPAKRAKSAKAEPQPAS